MNKGQVCGLSVSLAPGTGWALRSGAEVKGLEDRCSQDTRFGGSQWPAEWPRAEGRKSGDEGLLRTQAHVTQPS